MRCISACPTRPTAPTGPTGGRARRHSPGREKISFSPSSYSSFRSLIRCSAGPEKIRADGKPGARRGRSVRGKKLEQMAKLEATLVKKVPNKWFRRHAQSKCGSQLVQVRRLKPLGSEICSPPPQFSPGLPLTPVAPILLVTPDCPPPSPPPLLPLPPVRGEQQQRESLVRHLPPPPPPLRSSLSHSVVVAL